jgi:hypothetical protein
MGIGWNFPSNNFSQLNGISEAGIETFRGTPYSSLAREICQNSLDAILDKDKPVTVEFKKIYIDKYEIPGYEELKDALDRCLDFWSACNNKKAIDFFQNSCNVINKEKISVLRISDFNTVGLIGSDKEYEITPWQSLVKSSGVSDKMGSAGGSFGIGKSAPFVCSDIRTLFYSTYDINGLTATQGVSRLVSFRDKNNQITQGIGYYGNKERNTPLRTELGMDETFDRDDRTGTDIYIIGFMEDNNWKEEMVASVLEGFLLSTYNNKLIVKIEDVIISKENLPLLIEQYQSTVKYAYNYYQVLTSDETITIKEDFAGLGEIELKILLSQNLHRKVLIARSTGMKIFDKQNISSTIQFAAILTLNGEEVNKFFRDMESPQHDAWEPDRHKDKKIAKKRRTELFRFIKEQILNIGRSNSIDELDAEGVGEFLPDNIQTSENERDRDIEETISDKTKQIDIKVVDKVSITKGTTKIYDILANEEIATTGEFSDDDSDGEGRKPTGKPNSTSGGIGTPAPAKGKEDGNFPIKKYVEVGLASTRLLLTDKASNKYKLIMLPEKNAANGFVKINLSGEQSNVEADILSAYNESDSVTLKCSKGKIFIDKIVEKKKIILSFILDYSDNCSMEVGLYGYQI